MFELYKSEMLKLWKGALMTCVGLVVFYAVLPKFGFWEIMHRNMGFLLLVGGIIMSLGFGIFQALLWKKKNFWIFLIHRPLSPKNICFSMLGAGITVLLVTVSLSLMVTTIAYDVFTDKVVDLRHYQFIVYITLVMIACYMVGTLSVLHRSKFTILVFYTLFIAFFPEPRNFLAQYLPLLLLLSALVYLNIKSFKPDLKKPIDSAFGNGLLATGVSYSLVIVLIIATTLFYHFPMMILGEHPDMNPKDGAMKLMWENNFENGVGYILQDSSHKNADHYASQASMAERIVLPIRALQQPRRHQLHRFDNRDSIIDPSTKNVWKFSHDEMLLVGVDATSNKRIGAIGKKGFIQSMADAREDDRFDQVPHLSEGRLLSTKDALYSLDFETKTMLLKHQPPAGEHYTSSLWFDGEVGRISTTTQLLMFNRNTLYDDFSELSVDYRFIYPDSVKNSETAYGLKVADGYLLVFIGEHYFGFDRPGAEVFITRLDGSSELIGKREFFIHDLPAWVRHYNFWVAPFIFVTEEWLSHTIDPYESRYLSTEQLMSQNYPKHIVVMAIILQLASVLLLWLLMRRQAMASSHRPMWLLLGGVLGLPALLSYLVLRPIPQS